MKERPILFSGPMVKAILKDRKTQTRRILNCEHPVVTGFVPNGECGYWKGTAKSDAVIQQYISTFPLTIKCPFGIVGDCLWVRETFCMGVIEEHDASEPGDRYLYVDDSDYGDGKQYPIYKQKVLDDGIEHDEVKWKPSIHMPRSASRILLEITAIRVERLKDISESDAVAEGGPKSHPSIDRVSRSLGFKNWSCSHFAQTWDWDNTVKWEVNPWVWVVEFKVIQGGKE